VICLPSLIEIKGIYRKRTDKGRLSWRPLSYRNFPAATPQMDA
jgi:hypothetical protein